MIREWQVIVNLNRRHMALQALTLHGFFGTDWSMIFQIAMAAQTDLPIKFGISTRLLMGIVTGGAIHASRFSIGEFDVILLQKAGTLRQTDWSEANQQFIIRMDFVRFQLVGSAMAFSTAVDRSERRQLIPVENV